MPARKILHHTPPEFVECGSWFFLTLCCASRGGNQLCCPDVSSILLDDAAFYHRIGKWQLHLFLLMPDHLHAIVAFPCDAQMSEVIRSWKRLVSRQAGIGWQKNYFDHRLRSDESLDEKADYIRQNPVRAGLVSRAADWPHFVDCATYEGR